MRDRLILIPALLALAAAFQGCSGEDVLQVADGGTEPVAPLAKVEEDGFGPVATNGFADGKDVFRLCAFISDEKGQEPADWTVKPGTEAFEDEPVDVTGGIPAVRTQKYYPPAQSGEKLWFYAYAPVGGKYNRGDGTTPPTVDYTITGQEDIMAGVVTNGNGIGGASKGETQRQPSFRFRHLLSRFTFKLVQGEGFASEISASAIGIVNCRTKARLDVADGTLTFEGEPAGSVRVTGTWAVKPEKEALELPNVHLLCEPVKPGEKLTVEVLVAGVNYRAPVTLTSDKPDTEAGAAGVSHLLTLTFKGTQVEAEGSIVPWEDVGEASGEIN